MITISEILQKLDFSIFSKISKNVSINSLMSLEYFKHLSDMFLYNFYIISICFIFNGPFKGRFKGAEWQP